MYPTTIDLIQRIHEERIRGARLPRPEWMYDAPQAARERRRSTSARRLRRAVATVLRLLAASIEPYAQTGQAWDRPAGLANVHSFRREQPLP
jgi:hypothetical protein